MTAATSAEPKSGHPKGLYYLAFTEAWERFSYYGMAALVVLYMVNQLLLPGHVENVAGFAQFRAALESVYGPQSTQALASLIFGMYSGLVYFTPVIGGWIADNFMGQRNAVVLGAILMGAGHIAMAFDQSFLIALALLVTGSGFLKGNIAAQVGALYPKADESRRVRGFAIFSTAINIGATAGPILCGYLAQQYGWHVGFGAAAVFLFVGLLVYLSGYKHLPTRVERESGEGSALTGADWTKIALIIAVLVISTFQSIAYFQSFNVAPVWIQDHVNMNVSGFEIPVPWFNSIDPAFSILGVPILLALWQWQSQRGGEPNDLGKIGIGAWLACAANLILVAAILAFGDDGLSPAWPLLYGGLLGIAFLYYWPTLLAFVSRHAPASVNATMMGVTYLTLFFASNIMGRLGSFYEQMTPMAFWTLHAAIAACGGIAALLFGGLLTRALERQPS